MSKYNKETWSFKERLQMSFMLWALSVLAFFFPQKTAEVIAEALEKEKGMRCES